MENIKTRNRRYRLHYKIRKQGYRLSAKTKTIFASYALNVYSKDVQILRDEFNYSLQTEIE